MFHFVLALVEQPGQPFAHVRCLVGAYSVFFGKLLEREGHICFKYMMYTISGAKQIPAGVYPAHDAGRE
ncbi:hypothetical protein ES703_30136 [subsurface metagenome]